MYQLPDPRQQPAIVLRIDLERHGNEIITQRHYYILCLVCMYCERGLRVHQVCIGNNNIMYCCCCCCWW